MWHVVLIRLNCGAEKNIHLLMTFVLGDKLAAVTLTLQLVNLVGANRAPRFQPRSQGATSEGSTAGAPCRAPCCPPGRAPGSRRPLRGGDPPPHPQLLRTAEDVAKMQEELEIMRPLLEEAARDTTLTMEQIKVRDAPGLPP